MGIWRIGSRVKLTLILVSAVCIAGTTRKAEPGQNGGQTQGGQTQGPQNGPPPRPTPSKPGNRPQPQPNRPPPRPTPSRPPNRPQPQPSRPPNRPPPRPTPSRPPRPPGNYHFRPSDRDRMRRYYNRNLGYINRGRRPVFVVGGYIPFGDRGYFQPVPPGLLGYLAPPPPGYSVGYFDGYVVVYDPISFAILNLVNLLD